MNNCFQSNGFTVKQHGESVWEYTIKLLELMDEWEENNLPLPEWFKIYGCTIKDHFSVLLEDCFSYDILKEYCLNHDIGKFYCKVTDESGKVHFPNHANVSADLWKEAGGDPITTSLIRHDMDLWSQTVETIPAFLEIRDESNKHSLAPSLLVVGLAELLSNGIHLFGGYDSTSFKIKMKKITRLGNTICDRLYGGLK